MWKLTSLLTCGLFIGCIGATSAAPLNSPGTVYIDGIPCNRPCQAYMAWSRSLLPQHATPPIEQSAPSQIVQGVPKPKAKRQVRMQHTAPHRALPTRVAKKPDPKSTEVSINSSARPLEIRKAEIVPPGTITGAPPMADPLSGSETGTTSEQGLTAPPVQDLTTANQAGEQKLDSGTQTPGPPEAAAPNVETAALAPNNAEPQVAIIVARPEINSVSDLTNKVVAIDASRSDSVARVRTAIVGAGATEVQMSEGSTLAIERVINGEVPAAVVSIVDPEAAAVWSSGRPDIKIFRVPLSPPSENGTAD